MIKTEFRLIRSASNDADEFIEKFDLLQVPNCGELVNIKGNPYILFERGWAIGEDGQQFAYCRMTKHHEWSEVEPEEE